MSAFSGWLQETRAEQVNRWKAVFGLFTFRTWVVTITSAAVTLLLIGIPTVIIANPFFTRMTPVRPQDYVIWIMTGVLAGLVFGTYALPAGVRSGGKLASGGFLSFVAVGCPVCNKLVLILLGTSGALNYFAPAQLYIGIASLLLLGWALHIRVRSIAAGCPVVPA